MSEITFIAGGATAAQGFSATGEHMGIRRNRTRRDVALIVSEVPANAACVYTQNLVKGAPILVTQRHVENGIAQAVICNSGNANTCNANGVEIAEGMCALVEKYIGVKAEDVIVASTGVIGQPMTLEPFEKNFGKLADSLEDTPAGGTRAAEAIMTTDTVSKEVAVRFPLGGKMCKLGGISKGSGMIAPNMATMLCFLTTDAAISPVALKRALTTVTADTFNMLSIDGDTSTHVIVSRKVIGLSTLFIGRMIVSIVLSAGMVVVLDYCTIIQRYLTALNPNCSLIRGQPTSNFTSPRCATVNSNIL